ncbi:MAG: HAD family hydrolase [Candidatus Diapherotrites archaeon]|nr:HAD family hydrolase [Candidatus Diapherotrites archaeon]
MIKAIIFDLWNTIIPGSVDFKFLASLARNAGISCSDYISRFEHSVQVKKYSSLEEMKVDFDRDFFDISPKLRDLLFAQTCLNDDFKIITFPDSVSVLKKLRKDGYKLVLLSNTENISTEKVMKKLKLEKYFDVLGYSYDIGAVKPDKEAFSFVLKKLKLNPSEVLMVGDSMRSDIGGSQSAGMHNCLINRSGKILVDSKVVSEFEIQSLNEIPRILSKLND